MNREKRQPRTKPGIPKNDDIEALSLIYQGYKRLGELHRERYDTARKQILSGLTAATKALELGERLVS